MQKGDFVKMDYVGRIVLTGEIFDLTDESLAKKEGIHDPKQKYEPQLVIIGSGMTVPGVEKQLMKMKVGDKREFDVSQEDGFGRRDPRLIKVISLQKFYSQKMNPVPGAFVSINGRNARIQSVSGGRVRVDFNSPLAGKDLKYVVRVVEKVTLVEKKAKALLDHYGIESKTAIKEGSLTVSTREKLPDQVKQLINAQFKKWLPDVKGITYVVPSTKKAVKKLVDGKLVDKVKEGSKAGKKAEGKNSAKNAGKKSSAEKK